MSTVLDIWGPRVALISCGFISIFGFIFSFIITEETKDNDLDEIDRIYRERYQLEFGHKNEENSRESNVLPSLNKTPKIQTYEDEDEN